MNNCKVTKTHKIAIVSGLFVVFLAGRLLYAKYDYFQETDDMVIATGIAALVNNNIGDTYRYGPQLGYYRLVEFIDILLGSHISHIPTIMVTLSVVAGTLIPLFSLVAFRKELNFPERILLTFFLYINPILWMSSLYGNAAIVALLFALASIVLLSNILKKGTEFLALGLFGVGILIRADTVLLTPIIAFLVYQKHNSIKRLVITGAAFGIVMIVVYTLIFSFDSHMDNIHSTAKTHLLNPSFRTKFWFYLIWAMSPFLLIFATWGIRDLLVERRRLFICVILWCLPVFLFYFCSTTTPRYFLLTVFPIVLCSVIGLKNLAEILIKKYNLRLRYVWVGLLMTSSVHLFIGLGHFTPDRVSNIFKDAFIETHDGHLYTGGFLYHANGSILKKIFTEKKFRFPRFFEKSRFSNDLEIALQNLATDWGRSRTVIVLLDGYLGTEFHFHSQAIGANYISREPGRRDLTGSTETWLKIGNVSIMTIAVWSEGFAELDQFKAKAGDEIWYVGGKMEDTIHSKIPRGLGIIPIPRPGSGIRAFRFVKAQN